MPDIAKWNRDRKSKRVLAEVEATTAEAKRLGFTGTPSFAVEGPGAEGPARRSARRARPARSKPRSKKRADAGSQAQRQSLGGSTIDRTRMRPASGRSSHNHHYRALNRRDRGERLRAWSPRAPHRDTGQRRHGGDRPPRQARRGRGAGMMRARSGPSAPGGGCETATAAPVRWTRRRSRSGSGVGVDLQLGHRQLAPRRSQVVPGGSRRAQVDDPEQALVQPRPGARADASGRAGRRCWRPAPAPCCAARLRPGPSSAARAPRHRARGRRGSSRGRCAASPRGSPPG